MLGESRGTGGQVSTKGSHVGTGVGTGGVTCVLVGTGLVTWVLRVSHVGIKGMSRGYCVDTGGFTWVLRGVTWG